MDGARRKLAVILAADVVGSARLIGLDEGHALPAIRAVLTDVLGETAAQHDGRLVKTMGDGVLIEFASPVAAVTCACEVQRMLAERAERQPPERRVLLRIGLNQGEVVAQPDGDLYGECVNVAARLEAIAAPGGIVISSKVHDELHGKVALGFVDRGEVALKNIARPARVWSLGEIHATAIAPDRSIASPGQGPALGILAGTRAQSAAAPGEEARYAGLWIMLYASTQAAEGTLRVFGFVFDIEAGPAGLSCRVTDGQGGSWDGGGPGFVLADKLYLLCERPPRHDAMGITLFWGVAGGSPAILDGLALTRAGNVQSPPVCTRMVAFRLTGGSLPAAGHASGDPFLRVGRRMAQLIDGNLATALPDTFLETLTRDSPGGRQPYLLAVPVELSLAASEREVQVFDPPDAVRRLVLLRLRELFAEALVPNAQHDELVG